MQSGPESQDLSKRLSQLVKPTLKISALGVVAAQGERALVGSGGRFALIRSPE
jgi:hypothetical protein